MARIVSVGFETVTGKAGGGFELPREVADFLGIRVSDPIELAVTFEGLRVEAAAIIRPGLRVLHEPNDNATADLERIPANAPVSVTIWRPEDSDQAVAADPPERPAPWTAARFDEELERRKGSEVLRRARKIRDWAIDRNLRIWWGRGFEWGGWIPVVDSPSGRSYQIFELWTGGNLEIQFVYLKKSPAFSDLTKRDELLRRLNEIDGIALPPTAVDRRLSFPLADLANESALDELLGTLDWILMELGTETTGT